MKNSISGKKCNCLMITTLEVTAENGVVPRNFFTKSGYARYFVEFAKSFGASLKLVNLIKGEPLDIPTVVANIAAGKGQSDVEFEEIRELVVSPLKKNEAISGDQLIKKIEQKFINQKRLSLKELYNQYAVYKKELVRDSYAKVRKQLNKKGWRIDKIENGNYLLNNL